MPDRKRPLFSGEDDDPQRARGYSRAGRVPGTGDAMELRPDPRNARDRNIITDRDLALGQETTRPTGPYVVQSMRKGGTVKKTGLYRLHAGEKVIPAKKAAAPARKAAAPAARRAAPTRAATPARRPAARPPARAADRAPTRRR